MVTILPISSPTKRAWTIRDDNHRHFFGIIPTDEFITTISVSWKKNADSMAALLGRFKLDLMLLLEEDFIRTTDEGFLLRFQRSGNLIAIARNRSSPTLTISSLPSHLIPTNTEAESGPWE